MKKIVCFLLLFAVFTGYVKGKETVDKEVLIKKKFINNNAYLIICKGWPKPEIQGVARIESAKEAALINAQTLASEIFTNKIDVIKFGTIKKYEVFDDYVKIHYVIKYANLIKYQK